MITYLQSISPIKISKKNSRKTQEFTEIYSKSSEYKLARKAILSQFPELASFSVKRYEGKNLLDTSAVNNSLLITALKQIPQCNLLSGQIKSLADNICLINFFNCYVDVEFTQLSKPALFDFIHGKNNIINQVNSYPSDKLSAIIIPLHTSKRKLLSWINENWKEINKSNRQLPKFSLNSIHQNIIIGKEISDLRAKNQTFAEIANILAKKYPDDERLTDENQIKTIYARYVKYLISGITDTVVLNSLMSNS